VTTPVRADVCIIGGGLVGCSTAYQLAKRGADVLVLERAWVGAGSSGRGMGGIRQQFDDALDIALVRASLPVFREFGAFAERGYLLLAETEAGRTDLATGVEALARSGVAVRMLDRREIADLVPGIRTDDLVGGRLGPQDGYGEPKEVLARFVEEAKRLGARFAEEQNVTAIGISSGHIGVVESTSLRVIAGMVLVACGAWSADLLATSGVDLPIWPYRRQLARAGPFPGLAGIPMTIEWESGLHFRPVGPDQLFAMPNVRRDGSLEKGPAARTPPPPMIVDPRTLAWARERAARRHPAFADLRFTESWACYYEMTPDDHPVIGAVSGVEGLYVAAGFSGHGFMQSPAVGVCMAELLTEGRAKTVDLEPFSAERFQSGRSTFAPSVL
jgi:sarcosine oxidase subunit beta